MSRSMRISLGCVLAALVACGEDAIVLEAIEFSQPEVYGAVGLPQTVPVIGRYSDGSTSPLADGLVWASSDPEVAVAAGGLLVPLAPGEAIVTARDQASGREGSLRVLSRAVAFLDAEEALATEGAVDRTVAYFRVSGLRIGGFYNVRVPSMTDDVDLLVYADFSLTEDARLCGSDMYAQFPESCLAPAGDAGELWIVVTGEWTFDGASFDLTIEDAEPLEIEGTLRSPDDLPQTHTLAVEKHTYEVVGLPPGGSVGVRVTDLTADIDVTVFDDAYGYALLCESYGTGLDDDVCEAEVGPDGRLFVEVDGRTSPQGGSYILKIEPI